MAKLIDGALATGDNSFTPGQAPPVSRGGSEPWDILRLDRNMNSNDNSGDNDSNGNGGSNDMIDPDLRNAGLPPFGDAAAAYIDTPPAVSGDGPTIKEEAPFVSPFELDCESQ
jgi:hypothetical protein